MTADLPALPDGPYRCCGRRCRPTTRQSNAARINSASGPRAERLLRSPPRRRRQSTGGGSDLLLTLAVVVVVARARSPVIVASSHPEQALTSLAALPRPEALIFDLDGTLVDTVETRIEAWLRTFEEDGITADRDHVAGLIGADGKKLAREVAERAGRGLSDADQERIDKRSGEIYDQLNTDPGTNRRRALAARRPRAFTPQMGHRDVESRRSDERIDCRVATWTNSRSSSTAATSSTPSRRPTCCCSPRTELETLPTRAGTWATRPGTCAPQPPPGW